MAKEKKNQSEMEQYEEYILLKKGAEAELVEKNRALSLQYVRYRQKMKRRLLLRK